MSYPFPYLPDGRADPPSTKNAGRRADPIQSADGRAVEAAALSATPNGLAMRNVRIKRGRGGRTGECERDITLAIQVLCVRTQVSVGRCANWESAAQVKGTVRRSGESERARNGESM